MIPSQLLLQSGARFQEFKLQIGLQLTTVLVANLCLIKNMQIADQQVHRDNINMIIKIYYFLPA